MSTCPNCLIDYGRGEDGVNRYYIRFCPLHKAAAKMYEALGTAREALTNEWLYQTGQFHRPAANYPPQGSVHGSVGDAMPIITAAIKLASVQEQGE